MKRMERRGSWPFLTVGMVIGSLSCPGSATAQEPSRFVQECPPSDPSQVAVSLSGTVMDRESGVPLPGSLVQLTYKDPGSLPAGTPEEMETVTSARGSYRFCGLVAFAGVELSAAVGDREGRDVDVDLNGDIKLDLTVDLGNPAYLVFSVVDAETGAPIPNATVELSPIPLAAMTDSLGRAALREVPPFEYDIRARHIGFAEQAQALAVEEGQQAEVRIELVTQAVELEPLRVEITGRDPYLLEMGFYERMNLIPDGYFATQEEIEPYIMFRTLFQFKKELFVRYARNRFVMIDGWPMTRRGFRSIRELNEIPFTRVRGIESYPCFEAPPEVFNRIPVVDLPMGDCNVLMIWTR